MSLKYVASKSVFPRIQSHCHKRPFLKSLYLNTRLGGIYCVGCCKKTSLVNFLIRLVCIRLNARRKTLRACLPERVAQSAPTTAFITWVGIWRPNVCLLPLIVSHYTVMTLTTALIFMEKLVMQGYQFVVWMMPRNYIVVLIWRILRHPSAWPLMVLHPLFWPILWMLRSIKIVKSIFESTA